MKSTPKKMSPKGKVAIGAGVVALAAAAAGTYFFYGSKNATKNRATAKAWSLKAKQEIIKEMKKASITTEKGYKTAVKEVAQRYKKLQKLDPKDVQAFVSELGGHWKNISKELKSKSKKPATKKKPSKKGAKK